MLFYFSDISPPDCLKDGATLLFTLYDRHLFSSDAIAGEVYYHLQNVPALSSESVQGAFATAPQIELPFIIGTLDGAAMKGLSF